ncbi:MAG: hypothetical protein WBF99_09055 [Xanthobacteraceae bacterium]
MGKITLIHRHANPIDFGNPHASNWSIPFHQFDPALGSNDMPVDDMHVHDRVVQVDGRLLKEVYLLQVKGPGESTGP